MTVKLTLVDLIIPNITCNTFESTSCKTNAVNRF